LWFQDGIRAIRLGAAMANIVQTSAEVRGCGKTNSLPRDNNTRQLRDDRLRDDPLRPAKGLLSAAGFAAAIWAVIGLLVWWIAG
jgi:hypothetical protein